MRWRESCLLGCVTFSDISFFKSKKVHPISKTISAASTVIQARKICEKLTHPNAHLRDKNMQFTWLRHDSGNIQLEGAKHFSRS